MLNFLYIKFMYICIEQYFNNLILILREGFQGLECYISIMVNIVCVCVYECVCDCS